MIWVALLLALPAQAQLASRGYLETRGLGFPQTTVNDSGHAVGEAILRWDLSYQRGGWRLNGGIDSRTDTHHMVEREARIDWQDRSFQRPALSLRRFSAQYHYKGLTVETGKQFVRWGKADILNPTDRFAPRDYLELLNTDFLGILAVRATYEKGSNTFDVVYTPRMTPSRTPLANQRWGIPGIDIGDRVRYPGAGQAGARWSHIGAGYEFSGSFFEGFQHLPSMDATFTRFYPRLRMYGADFAMPLRWFSVKSEAAYFTSSDLGSNEFVLYVVQLERQQGEWSFVGGYAGEAVTAQRNPYYFAPDRGIARTFLGRAGYTINASRSVAAETAVRQDGSGAYVKGEYSQTFGLHWRATAGFVLLVGRRDDFLGQYRRNSHGLLTIRYSF